MGYTPKGFLLLIRAQMTYLIQVAGFVLKKVTPEPRVLLTRRTKREHNDSNEIRYLRPSVLTKGSWRVGAGRGTVVAQRKGARARVLLLPARTRGCQLALPSHLLPRSEPRLFVSFFLGVFFSSFFFQGFKSVTWLENTVQSFW